MAENIFSFESLETVQPEWLHEGDRPPWIPRFFWEETSIEDKAAILEMQRQALLDWLEESPGRLDWDEATQREAIQFYFDGIQAEGQRVLHPILEPDFGLGVSGEWDELKSQNRGAAQYLDLGFLGRGYPAVHFNLCGQLTVCGLMGLGLEEGLEVYREAGENIESMRDGLKLGSTTGAGHLRIFLAAASEEPMETSFLATNRAPPNDHAQTNPEALRNTMNEGIKVVALVNIIGGHLEMRGPITSLNIGHWVGLLDIMKPRQGEHLVWVYNPFNNLEEIYSWTTFKDAWKNSSTNTVEHAIVIARLLSEIEEEPIL